MNPQPMKRILSLLAIALLSGRIAAYPLGQSEEGAPTVTPTWSVSFDNRNDLDGFTIIDANGDSHMFEGILRGGWSWLSHEEVKGAACYYYDSQHAADDWLITPGINLKSGREYYISFDANAANIYPEKFEVYFGSAPTVEGMTQHIIAPTTVNKGEFESFMTQVSVDKPGVYYVGIHAISDRSQYILDIKNLKVEAGILASAPAQVQDLTLTADPAGLNKATVSFVLPTQQNDGAPLTEITKVEVFRDGALNNTLTDVQPGGQVSFTDAVPASGLYTYSVVVYNANGDGAPAVKKVFVGYDAPTPPINPHVVDKFSSIDLVWEQSLGQNGGLIKRSDMSYYIYAIDEEGNVGNRLATVTKGKLLYNIPMDTQSGEQHLLTYAMIAANSQGLSERVETKGFLVGKPLDYPFGEHFAGQSIENFWWVSGQGLGYDNQYAGFTLAKSAADNDGGSLIFEGFFDDDIVTLHSAKISLEGAEHPWLTFSHKAMAGTEVIMHVLASGPEGTCDTLRTIDYRSYDAQQWTREIVDLAPYADKGYVVIEFAYENYSDEKATIAYLDNIIIGEVEEQSVAADFDCASTVVAGERLTHSVSITNNGYTAVEVGVFTDVNASGPQYEEVLLQPMQKQTLSKTIDIPFTDAGKQYEISMKVVLPNEGGENELVGEKLQTVSVQSPNIAAVTDVLGTKDTETGMLTITWKAPTDPARKVTDDFESYSPFMTENIGEWTMVDKDGGISEQLFAGYETGLEDQAYAFTTFNLAALNPGLLDTNEEFAARSGNQCLAAFFCHDGYFNYSNQNNWLISPLLTGKSQKISLYAANYGIDSPEVFEILYSMTDNQPGSFIRIGAERRVADSQWHPFTATLPTGARYFAIHHYTDEENAYMFKLDDISFTKALEVEAYEIYINNVYAESVTDCQYTATVTDEDDTYAVAVRYTDGSVSAPISMEMATGIQDALSAEHPGNAVMYNTAGQRVNESYTTRRGNIIILNGKKYIRR